MSNENLNNEFDDTEEQVNDGSSKLPGSLDDLKNLTKEAFNKGKKAGYKKAQEKFRSMPRAGFISDRIKVNDRLNVLPSAEDIEKLINGETGFDYKFVNGYELNTDDDLVLVYDVAKLGYTTKVEGVRVILDTKMSAQDPIIRIGYSMLNAEYMYQERLSYYPLFSSDLEFEIINLMHKVVFANTTNVEFDTSSIDPHVNQLIMEAIEKVGKEKKLKFTKGKDSDRFGASIPVYDEDYNISESLVKNRYNQYVLTIVVNAYMLTGLASNQELSEKIKETLNDIAKFGKIEIGDENVFINTNNLATIDIPKYMIDTIDMSKVTKFCSNWFSVANAIINSRVGRVTFASTESINDEDHIARAAFVLGSKFFGDFTSDIMNNAKKEFIQAMTLLPMYNSEKYVMLGDEKYELAYGINVIMGPSGSGKSTLIHKIKQNYMDASIHKYSEPEIMSLQEEEIFKVIEGNTDEILIIDSMTGLLTAGKSQAAGSGGLSLDFPNQLANWNAKLLASRQIVVIVLNNSSQDGGQDSRKRDELFNLYAGRVSAIIYTELGSIVAGGKFKCMYTTRAFKDRRVVRDINFTESTSEQDASADSSFGSTLKNAENKVIEQDASKVQLNVKGDMLHMLLEELTQTNERK